jgi:halimadienyl-diphosphate synthase
MIIPTLFAEAEALGIVQHWDYGDMTRLNQQRAAKLAALPGGMINRFVTLAFSAEMAGPDGMRLLDVPNLQEINGSLAHSPSATAYYALHVSRDDPNALRYLRQTASLDGGMPDVAPFDNFERSWTLWNLRLVDDLDTETIDLCQRHLDFLQSAWRPGIGVGHAAGFTPTDSDMTGVVYEVLDRFERYVDREAILSYEESDYFRCYALEANPSVSANIHVLGALRQAGFDSSHPAIHKIERFLESTQFWFDKWHVSPYYPTSHGIIACAGYLDYLAQDAINWILATQQANGSWGYYMPTAEETAYCLQALAVWQRHGHPVPADTFKRGEQWLLEHAESPYPPLWIGKCLYCPELVVKSAILSALMLVNEGIYV